MEQTQSIGHRSWLWWEVRRLKYNLGLVIAGVTAFILYCIVGEVLIGAKGEFEVTIFTIAFQGIGYLFMMLLANLFYFLGYLVDRSLNKANDDGYRERLYRLGYWFSFCLPFLIPLLLVIIYL